VRELAGLVLVVIGTLGLLAVCFIANPLLGAGLVAALISATGLYLATGENGGN
jgi:hypothetical protein